VRAEGNVTPAQAKQRAEWEAIVRAGRAYTASVTVQGWTVGGRPWPVNALVRLRSPSLEIDSDMLITEATYSLDDGGSRTVLSLKRPDAFMPEPVIEPVESAGKTATGKSKPSGKPWAELKGGV
jgi:prophage tail gpP-like protein